MQELNIEWCYLKYKVVIAQVQRRSVFGGCSMFVVVLHFSSTGNISWSWMTAYLGGCFYFMLKSWLHRTIHILIRIRMQVTIHFLWCTWFNEPTINRRFLCFFPKPHQHSIGYLNFDHVGTTFRSIWIQ